jgi:hypothetical protein
MKIALALVYYSDKITLYDVEALYNCVGAFSLLQMSQYTLLLNSENIRRW